MGSDPLPTGNSSPAVNSSVKRMQQKRFFCRGNCHNGIQCPAPDVACYNCGKCGNFAELRKSASVQNENAKQPTSAATCPTLVTVPATPRNLSSFKKAIGEANVNDIQGVVHLSILEALTFSFAFGR